MSRTSSLTSQAYELLRADLLACRFMPGERLVINELCGHLAVSLGAVREALSRLTAEGLVTAQPQRGFRAAPISVEDLRDLTAVRLDIESLCMRRSISCGDLPWETRVLAACDELARTPECAADDPRRYSDAIADAHRLFHEALVSACDSPWLLRLRQLLYSQAERYRCLSGPLTHYARDLNREHRAIMEAALARDADKAIELLVNHVKETTKILLDAPWGSVCPLASPALDVRSAADSREGISIEPAADPALVVA